MLLCYRSATVLRNYATICECNAHCGCPANCAGRLVQWGMQAPLEIYSAGAGKGFGVRCTVALARNTFVCEYAGEAVPPGFERDVGEMTFVIQVDRFGGTAHRFGVDGSTRANLGRVFNHSCDPNMRLVLVDEGGGSHAAEGGGTGDPPRIAFFASRDIELGEELTWRYNGRTTGGIPCLCGAERCKGWL